MRYLRFIIFCATFVTNGLCDRACSRNTCLNGGTCTVNDDTRMFQCECPQGFSGLLCQDNCSLHCLNGNCSKGTFGEETCQCNEGWMGSLCDIVVAECSPQCADDQRCTKGADGVFVCLNETACATHTCQNNGSCVEDKGVAKCKCVNGFSGDQCEIEEDRCKENFCQNGASCENIPGGYSCNCAKGFSGKYCETQDKKQCTPDYCKNGGTCSNNGADLMCTCPDTFEGEFCESKVNNPLIQCTCENTAHVCSLVNGSSTCECPSGFMGPDCKELKTRPCDLEPCLNGGHCVDDGQNLFTCFCLPHWTGVYCGEPVECLVNGVECKNNGKCVFSLTSTRCDCPEGFTGDNCEISNSYRSHPTCTDIRCQNGGNCKLDAEGEPYCECPEGFDGPFCEPKSGCTINPCQNGGTCQDADGQYFCHCTNGFLGVHCETPEEPSTPLPTLGTFPVFTTSGIDHTQSEISCEDCVNSSNCMEAETGPICICQDGFFGQKCDQKHDKCAKVSCPAGQTCSQVNENSNITAQCGCEIGHFGQKCEMVTSATFTAKSLYIHQSSKFSLGTSSFENIAYELEFSFRTTVENTHLTSSENILGEKILSVQLMSGFLVFNVTGNFMPHLLPLKVNDAKWYTITIKGEHDKVQVEVLTENGFQLVKKTVSGQLDVFLTRFGKVSGTQNFIGCMADVRVDGELIIFTDSKRAIEIRKGCTRSEQCSRAYCQNDGVCVDHWESSSCKCKPPFLKPNCAYFLPKTTFGHLDQPSIVHLSTSESENHLLRNQIELSFLMRSGKSDAVLFYIGEKHAADVLTNYLIVKIAGGLISVRYRTGGRREVEFSSKNRVDDNEEHHVQIFVDKNRRQVIIDDLTETSEPIISRMSQEFYVDDILIGASNVLATDPEFYKGYLQDIQLNQKSIIIHSTSLAIEKIGKLEKTQNIMEGAVSDPVCNSNTCKHGECSETFNDFTCKCSDGSTGKHCDKIDFCKDTKCMEGSKCVNSDNGHYCVFPITISNNSKLTYNFESKSSLQLPYLKFSMRTHSPNGHIFTLTIGKSTLSAFLFKRRLILVNGSSQKFDTVVSDGKWHDIVLHPYKITIDGHHYISTTELFPAESKLETNLFVGDQGKEAIFACLDNFQLGDYPMLSFTKAKIPTVLETWTLTEKLAVGTGCISTEQCGLFSTCLNGGTCVDIWNKRKCTCSPGFTGENCEENVNDCKFVDCGKNGYCLDGIDEAKCVCNNGFTGEHCEHAVDECEGTECHNEAKCVKNKDKVMCECQGPWMGDHCNITVTTNCKDGPCQNFGQCMQKTDTSFECNCMDGYSGDLCEQRDANECNHYDCNRGHCVMTVSGPACQCELGYTGRFCEKLLNQCSSNTCSSRGTCSPVWNNTVCSCDKSWRGSHCQYQTNSCLDFPCNNDGVCKTNDKDNSFTCECQKFFMGTRCEIEGSCLKADCVHGECIQLSAERHTCSCNIGYEGNACDKRIDYCKAQPCMNGASCENKLTGYKCTCPIGFEGADCEVNIDECALGYCKNGAKCRDKINDYECLCEGTGYEGRNCTVDINECENPNNCINGECLNTLGGYKCGCRNGFIGPRCSMRNPCTAQISSNNVSSVTCVHGKCVNPVVHIEKNREVAKYECACDRGYTGPTCSQRVKESAMSNISYLFGPIIAIVVVFAIVGCLLLFFVIRGNNAMHGHYSPSSHEFSQNRMAMPTVIKLPPQERLI